jgi:hypothetical protein
MSFERQAQHNELSSTKCASFDCGDYSVCNFVIGYSVASAQDALSLIVASAA